MKPLKTHKNVMVTVIMADMYIVLYMHKLGLLLTRPLGKSAHRGQGTCRGSQSKREQRRA